MKNKQLARIEHYEALLDELTEVTGTLQRALAAFEEAQPKVEELAAYYESDLWKRDFADDEAGKLPPELKRGVLSEDAVYDLLEEIRELRER